MGKGFWVEMPLQRLQPSQGSLCKVGSSGEKQCQYPLVISSQVYFRYLRLHTLLSRRNQLCSHFPCLLDGKRNHRPRLWTKL